MNLDFSVEERAFRDEARTWLRENYPDTPRPEGGAAMREYDTQWQRRQYEGGWAGVAWPVEYGGRGASLLQQMIWYEEYAKTGARDLDSCFVGLYHAGPTLMARASEEQRAFHLAPILRGDVVWCQGFSEPGAGSDLAGLRTSAELDGDELVVTGQKLWTSFADIADYQELLVRTDRNGSRHQGLTWVVCDMRSPGITVRPIETIEHSSHFCEVFYDEVRIPVHNVVGGLGNGWSVAMSTLSFERGTSFAVGQVQLASLLEEVIALAAEVTGPDGRRPALADDEMARELATARAEVAALRSMMYASVSRNARLPQPGPEGSMIKLYFSELRQRVCRLAMEILGAQGWRWQPVHGKAWYHEYLLSYAMTIGGGTSEIQRNIIGERVLGLPR
ncbi:MAG TPA: acyl-CoA dehydrogenase family protein [Mycobacteriales bacterium]|nr:acyl-CoA dehydrogenase family protein [Mycobacteriales bacterium]